MFQSPSLTYKSNKTNKQANKTNKREHLDSAGVSERGYQSITNNDFSVVDLLAAVGKQRDALPVVCRSRGSVPESHTERLQPSLEE